MSSASSTHTRGTSWRAMVRRRSENFRTPILLTPAPAVFIYSMPGYSVPIKERMMYSSCRNAVVEVIESTLGIKLEKKIEIDTGAELTEDFLRVSVCGN